MSRAERRAAEGAPTIAEAKLALEAGEPARALQLLLKVWRQAPEASLADRIVHLGDSIATKFDVKEWEKRAQKPKPEDVSTLLALVKGTSGGRRERAIAMLEWPAEPRVDRYVAKLYAEPPFTSTGARPFWTQVALLAQKVVDQRARESMKATRAGWNDVTPWQVHLAGHVDRALAEQPPVAPPLSEVDRAALEAIDAFVKKGAPRPGHNAQSIDALMNDVLARPADPQARAVLMDALLEAGAPRGQLMALHASARGRELSAAERKQEKKLIDSHRAELLGPLAEILSKAEFSDGFLSVAAIKQSNSNLVRMATKRTVGQPHWATVKRLSGADPVIAGHSVMRSLEVLEGSGVPDGPVPTLTTMTRTMLTNHQQVKRLSTFPALKHLEVTGDDPLLLDLVNQDFAKRLAFLRMGTSPIVPYSSTERWVGVAIVLGLPELVVDSLVWDAKGWGTTFRFTRSEGKLALSIEPSRTPDREPSADMYSDSMRVLELWGGQVASLRLLVDGVPQTDALSRLMREVVQLGGGVVSASS